MQIGGIPNSNSTEKLYLYLNRAESTFIVLHSRRVY